MTDITQLARDAGGAEFTQPVHTMLFTDRALAKLEQLLRDKFIAELGEPVGYAVPDYAEIMQLRNGCTLISKDKTDLHLIPLYALKDERK